MCEVIERYRVFLPDSHASTVFLLTHDKEALAVFDTAEASLFSILIIYVIQFLRCKQLSSHGYNEINKFFISLKR